MEQTMSEENDNNETNEEAEELTPEERKRMEMRQAVRFFYDFQKLRIQSSNRSGTDQVALSRGHLDTLAVQAFLLETLEKKALTNVKNLLKEWPIYNTWLKDQKGCGPTMSGVLLSEIDIRRADTPSAIWSYCGLAVVDGHAQRRKKGEKCGYNPWLKSKVVKVLADCMIKAKSPWREFYDNYKNRKQNQRVDVCMACAGRGRLVFKEDAFHGSFEQTGEPVQSGDEKGKIRKCSNCKGTGGPAPWGKSDAHRHAAAMRYMVKMFLLEFWKEWRNLEELPIVESYAEAYLGRRHGDHGGSLQPSAM
jgi:hypothetical protein